MWGLNLDAICGSAPASTLRQVLSRSTPTPTPASTDPSQTATASGVSGYTATPVDAAAGIGTVVLPVAQEQSACSASFPSAGDSTAPSGVWTLTGGRVLVNCGDTTGLVMMDVFNGKLLWTRASGAVAQSVGEVISIGTAHVFVVATTQVAATGLDAAYVTRTVSAYDLGTGSPTWTVPLEETVPKDRRNNSLQPNATVVESPTGIAAHPQAVAVGVDALTLLDTKDGSPVWSTKSVTGDYIGYGISIERTSDPGSGNLIWKGYAAGTGKLVWQTRVPSIAQGANGQLVGDTYWQIGRDGLLAVQVPTGHIAMNRKFPQEWTSEVATPSYIVAYDGKQLQMFKTVDVRTPLWSVPGDQVTPLAVTGDLVITQAPSGLVAVDGHTGAIRSDLSLPSSSSNGWQVTDGLVVMSDNSVLELSPPGRG